MLLPVSRKVNTPPSPCFAVEISQCFAKGERCCFCSADGGLELQRLLRNACESARSEGACVFAPGHLVASFNVGQRADGTGTGNIFIPLSPGDRTPDSGQTPISTVLFTLPPKESLAQICPKFPSLWLSLKKKTKQNNQPKKDRKKSKLCLECSRRLNHRGCRAFKGAAPALLHGRDGAAG